MSKRAKSCLSCVFKVQVWCCVRRLNDGEPQSSALMCSRRAQRFCLETVVSCFVRLTGVVLQAYHLAALASVGGGSFLSLV